MTTGVVSSWGQGPPPMHTQWLGKIKIQSTAQNIFCHVCHFLPHWCVHLLDHFGFNKLFHVTKHSWAKLSQHWGRALKHRTLHHINTQMSWFSHITKTYWLIWKENKHQEFTPVNYNPIKRAQYTNIKALVPIYQITLVLRYEVKKIIKINGWTGLWMDGTDVGV